MSAFLCGAAVVAFIGAMFDEKYDYAAAFAVAAIFYGIAWYACVSGVAL